MENSTATISSDAPPSETGPPLQPEQNLPPDPQQSQQAVFPQENYLKSKIGIIKIVCLIFAAIAFGLTLAGVFNSTYFVYTCTDDERGRYEGLAYDEHISSSKCEEFIRGTYQHCEHTRKWHEIRQLYNNYNRQAEQDGSCPNPLLITVPLIFNGIVFGVAVILLIVPAVSPNYRNNLNFLKSDTAWQYLGFVVNLISLPVGIAFWVEAFLTKAYSCHGGTRGKGEDSIDNEECHYRVVRLYSFWVIVAGGVVTLIAAILYCVVGCMLMPEIRRRRNQIRGVTPGVPVPGGMMTGGMAGQSPMMGAAGYGSPMVSPMMSQGYMGGGQMVGMGYMGGAQMGGMYYGSPMMVNNVGMMSTQPIY